jgi:hypothetical protein
MLICKEKMIKSEFIVKHYFRREYRKLYFINIELNSSTEMSYYLDVALG